MMSLSVVLLVLIVTLGAASPATTNSASMNLELTFDHDNTGMAINTTVSTLERRQCVWNPVTGQYDCDDNLPTLQQIIIRMQDASDGGQATPENHGFFYTNLLNKASPQYKEDFQRLLQQIYVWAHANKIDDNWFVAAFSLNSAWNMAQGNYLKANSAALAAKYNMPNILKVFEGCYCQAMAYAIKVMCPVFGGFETNVISERGGILVYRYHQKMVTRICVGSFGVLVWRLLGIMSSLLTPNCRVLTREGGPVQVIYMVDPRPPCEKPIILW